MKQSSAEELATDLRQLDEVDSAGAVHFDERGGTTFESADAHETPEDDLYGVSFYAYDGMIPQNVINVLAQYETQGILTHPDPGVVTPKPE